MSLSSHYHDEVHIDLRMLLHAVWQKRLRIVASTALLLVLTYLLLSFVPRLYESSASLLIEPRDNAFTRATNEAQSNFPVDQESIVASEVQLIQSRDTLLAVVQSEGLADVEEFGASPPSLMSRAMQLLGRAPTQVTAEEKAIKVLKENLKVAPERSSRVISVDVRSQDPELAARVANAIAQTHVERRAALLTQDTAKASEWLGSEIEKMSAAVAAAEGAVADFKVENDLFQGSNNNSLLDQQLSDLAGQLSTTQERKNNARSRAQLIRGLLDAGQPIGGTTDVRASVVVQQLSEEKARLQGERAQLRATLLDNHPEVQAITAQIAEINNQIRAEGRRIADGLDAEARIEADLETTLTDDLTRLKLAASAATRSTVTLNELEREATARRALLENYLLRFREASARTDASAALPAIRVITVATPARAPASPQTTLILAAVAIVSLALQVGAVLVRELASGNALVTYPVLDRRPEDEEPPAHPGPAKAVPDIAQPDPLPDAILKPLERESAPAAPTQPPKPAVAAPAQSQPVETKPAPESEPVKVRDLRSAEQTHRPVATVPSAIPDEADDRLFPPQAGADAFDAALTTLADSVAAGDRRILVLTTLTPRAETMIETRLADHLHENELSLVRVDAQSGRPTASLGLTDLCAGHAGFGDVVHRNRETAAASVPWGQGNQLDRRSNRPATLVEALADLYELVVVDAGRLGLTSSLPLFAGLPATVVVAHGEDVAWPDLEQARQDIEDLGFADIVDIRVPARHADVA